MAGTLTVNLVGKFASYDSSYSTLQPITITLVDNCTGGAVQTSGISDIYYEIGSSTLTLTFPPWNYTASNISSCGSFFYSGISTNYLTFDANYRTINIWSNSVTDDGWHTFIINGVLGVTYSSGTKIYQ